MKKVTQRMKENLDFDHGDLRCLATIGLIVLTIIGSVILLALLIDWWLPAGLFVVMLLIVKLVRYVFAREVEDV